MSLPYDLLLLHPREGSRRVALELLDRIDVAAGRLEDPDDGEALHDFRVSIRRLRSTLRAWKAELKDSVRRKDRNALRDVQRSTGMGRDAEVALAWLADQAKDVSPAHLPGHRWLVRRLEHRLASSLDTVRAEVIATWRRIGGRLRSRLGRLQQEIRLGDDAQRLRFGVAWAARLGKHSEDLVKHLARVDSALMREEAHAARIRVKRLRYLLEPAQAYAREADKALGLLRGLQDLLGDLQDAHVLDGELGAALEDLAVEPSARLHDVASQGNAVPVRNAVRSRERSGLLALTRRVRDRIETLFETLAADWLGSGLYALGASVGVVAGELLKAAGAGREIERKYLLDGLPALEGATAVQEIEQGWLPGEVLRERVRRLRQDGTTRYFRTVKFGRGVERTEFEEETTQVVFDALWPLTEGCRVRKRRHLVPSGEHVWEIDEFLDRDLALAEVELLDATQEVALPEWLAPCVVREVTTESGFTNLELAR